MAFDIRVEQIRSNSAKGVEFQDSLQFNAPVAIADSAAETIDFGASNYFTMIPTQDLATVTQANVGPVQEATFLITAPGTTGRSITDAAFSKLYTPSTTVSDVDIVTYLTIDGGTTWHEIAHTLNAA